MIPPPLHLPPLWHLRSLVSKPNRHRRVGLVRFASASTQTMASPGEFGSLLFASPTRERRTEDPSTRLRSPRYAARAAGASPTRDTAWRRVAPADVASPPPTQTLAENLRRPPETPARVPGATDGDDSDRPASSDGMDTWVTVYGFQPGDAATVLRTFQAMGEVVDFGSYGPAQANWMHIRFRTRHGAQRALGHDGRRIADGLIVGVKPIGEEDAQRIAEAREDNAGRVRFAPTAPTGWSRPYRIDADAQADGLPRPKHSTWDKITECVFGL